MSASSSGSHFGAAISPDELQSLYVEYSRASKTVDSKQEQRVAAKLCEVLKLHLRQKCDALIRAASNQPLLFSYSADATSLLLRTVETERLRSFLVKRHGKDLIELLMERIFVKTVSARGVQQGAIVYCDAKPLTEGKTSWNHFSGACDRYPHPRRLGHRSILIIHTCFDRAVESSLGRLLAQRAEGYYVKEVCPDGGDWDSQERLLTWFISTGCSGHDIQGGLKWASKPHFSEADLKDAYIAIESLRNTFMSLHKVLPDFLVTVVVFVEPPANRDGIYEFWQVLGVADEEMLVEIVEINPWWDGERLQVSNVLELASDKVERLSAVILYILKFRSFTGSRFLGLGPSARTVAASMAMGLQGLVQMVRANKTVTDYHLHGFARLTPKLFRAMVVVGLAAWVPDGAHVEAMADERLVKRFPEFVEALQDELSWLHNISSFTWARIESLVWGDAGRGIRNDVLQAGHVAAAYIHSKVSLTCLGESGRTRCVYI